MVFSVLNEFAIRLTLTCQHSDRITIVSSNEIDNLDIYFHK